jgi:radical SAM protein with 4Fe4S-binding SPASM domain
VETRDYPSWSLSVKQRIAARRVPLGGTFELTRRCNNRCRHCYNNLAAGDAAAARRELGTDEVIRLLGEIAEAGCVWVLLTGGEILLRPDFKEIYTGAKEKGLLVTLFTNATLVTPEVADHLVQYRPFSIEVTLYGATQATCERVTGVAGSFERCMAGIGLLRERGLPLKLKSTVSVLNQGDVREMKRLAAEELGLPFRFDALLNARCDGSREVLDLRLSVEEVVALDLADPDRAAALAEFARHRPAAEPLASDPGPLYRCGGGATAFAVDPYGRLRPCVISAEQGFDLRGGSFRQGWEACLARLRERRRDPGAKCSACGLRSLCGTCPANAALECGDPAQAVDFLCRVAHLRAVSLGADVPPHGSCEYCRGGSAHEEILRAAARLKEAS